MPTTEQLRGRLLKKLKELFQLDQPDLDFGFYRIMHAKARQVTEFIDKDLLRAIEDAFGRADDTRTAQLQAEYEKAIQTAREYEAPNPEETEPVKKAKAALDAAKDTLSAEGEIYDHLYRFFERYYDDGDFISRRYYTRETSGRAAPFAIPYNGEEVKLHWANADQYYIKTTEYFSNYTFDLRQARELTALRDQAPQARLMQAEDQSPLRVHFRVVDATEGEHNNLKESEGNKRFFIIHDEKPVELTEDGELVIKFEYRPDPEKSGQERTWREKRNAEAAEIVLSRLAEMAAEIDSLGEYLRCLQVAAPTDGDARRTLLAKYINQYTARNTKDYFIHKDLGGFLRRELDFYIKNEIMRLDDIENADAPAVDAYLAKIKVLRKIAGKLIEFLAQLEDFQKKLWLKKKFVVETNYCITLDLIPEEFYPEIAANDAQRDEWVRLLAINEIGPDLSNPEGYTIPLTVAFLQANKGMPLDTSFFDDAFKARLIASVDNLDERCDGLLIHSENFQALSLLQDRYREQVKCIYIDPPYNTDAGPILYKNGYRSASWITLMQDRLTKSRFALTNDGVLCVTIDDYQVHELGCLLDDVFGRQSQLGVSVIRNNPSGRSTVRGLSVCHEYAFFYKGSESATLKRLPRSERQLERFTLEEGQHVDWRNFRKDGGAVTHRAERPKQYYPIYVNVDTRALRIPQLAWNSAQREWTVLEQPGEKETTVWPIDEKGRDRVWSLNHTSAVCHIGDLEARISKSGSIQVFRRHKPADGVLPRSWWDKNTYAAREYGSATLTKLFGETLVFSFAKSPYAVQDCLWTSGLDSESDDCVLDYFAGSGTTGHAVINLNREDGGSRKYILVEMGEYFDSVLRPRIAKVVYSHEWKDGKPAARHSSISHCLKYIRLESYEDTLNNLDFDGDSKLSQAAVTNPSLKEDFMLHYLLDVETRGSQSLLNIDAFADPTAYTLKVKKPGSDEYVVRNVDLLETFNYLIGLRVVHIAAPQRFHAEFRRAPDPELPQDQNTKLVVDGKIKLDENGPWWFRKVEGWVPRDSSNPNNGQQEKVLIVWRKLTGDLERDNLMLDEWFQRNRISTRDFEFDTIYVNGSNNLPNLRLEEDTWKVRLIEEEFMKRMWDVETV